MRGDREELSCVSSPSQAGRVGLPCHRVNHFLPTEYKYLATYFNYSSERPTPGKASALRLGFHWKVCVPPRPHPVAAQNQYRKHLGMR
jgi:hypothetical protein